MPTSKKGTKRVPAVPRTDPKSLVAVKRALPAKSARQGAAETGDLTAVSGTPTKEFFVSMLVRDIELLPAVVDLVDNSVDGARRLRPDGDYSGLEVHIQAHRDHFVITDNCGGIPVDTAVKYAFRFGRDKKAGSEKHTIGQFGVGMKRAVFKLGRKFTVRSSTTKDAFILVVDVDDWLSRPDDWDFLLRRTPDEIAASAAETGTTLRVERLLDEVSDTFSGKAWRTDLAADLRLKHSDALNRNMRISVNDEPVRPIPLEIITSPPFRPTVQRLVRGKGTRAVTLRLVAGLARSQPEFGGWYVFCNGRLVLGPDKDETTVWIGKTNRGLPRYHDEYARFRGYAFFDSDDASALPWTTTKVGIDGDSALWVATRERMRDISKPVIRFLRELDRQRDAGDDSTDRLLEAARPRPIQALAATRSEFKPPPMKLPREEGEVGIAYSRPREQVDEAKSLLGVTTNRDVGVKTFEYFLDAEGE
ncbi:MAG: hypothetical protein CYG61_05475 [Actinobacteria bacterium]|nr:MAG: hypothetical protein CYG61_05475 [Actinomycetota bacterium]